MTRARPLGIALAIALAGLSLRPSPARAWELFRRPNPDVEEGNARLRANEHRAALEAYDRAAQRLPSAPEIPFDRGLALLAGGQLDEADAAFLRAVQPPASPELRASAYYNRGIGLLRQAEALAEAESHREAQARFRMAAESFRRSLAARPGNRDAAWNLELALRRLREEEEEQRQQEQQQQDQDNQQQDQDPQQQSQDPQQQSQDPQQQSQDPQQQSQDPQQQDQDNQQQDQDDQQQDQDPQQQGQDNQQQGREPQSQDQEPQGSGGSQEPRQGDERQGQPEPQPARPEPLPAEAARILDSLEDGEHNLERLRAQRRARRERRVPTKDW